MAQEGYGKYLETLKGDATQNALRNKQMPTPLLAYCVESGIVDVHDETLLFEIEKSVGRRLKPVVGDKTPLFARSEFVPPDMMYRQVVAETDKRLASDPILQHKAMLPSILYNAREDWCTPELMMALVLDPTFLSAPLCHVSLPR